MEMEIQINKLEKWIKKENKQRVWHCRNAVLFLWKGKLMKQLVKLFMLALISVSLMVPMTVFAVGDGNIDSGGGGTGQGTSQNKWSVGYDGVRVTVVRANDHAVVTMPIDLTNIKPPSTMFHFGKVSKIQYNNGISLIPKQGGYSYFNLAKPIPSIVNKSGGNNIAIIKKYFCSEYVIKRVAEITGMNYNILISGKYKLLLEPIAYYTFNGVMIASTATEAAMYDEKVNGKLRYHLGKITHQNLPLSMFLEIGDLGYSAWNGAIKGKRTNQEIKSSLGLGIVRFKDAETETPIIGKYDYEYRVGTEVITAITVSGGQSDPDNPARVNFNIGGTTYVTGNVYYPSGDSQLAWVKWKTPYKAQEMKITVYVQGPGRVSKSELRVKIVDLDKNPPPNPVADDRNDSYYFASVPQREEKTKADWSIWKPWWHEYWVWHSTGENSGYWCDHGWWEFELNKYYARLSGNMSIKADSKNPTSKGKVMKSGYGINETVSASIGSNQSSAVTYPQNAVSYFPEFQYITYWRLLERIQGGESPRFEYQKNKYSTYKNRTHFTPIWMPDGKYIVNTWLIDSWTPAGMLSMNLTDSLEIKGNLWDDWNIAPLKR